MDNNTHTLTAIDALIHGRLFECIDNLGNIREHHRATSGIRDYDIVELTAVVELQVRFEVEGLVAKVERTGRHVDILGSDNLSERLHREAIGLQLLGVDVHLHLTLLGTDNGYRADTVDAVKLVDHLIVQNLGKGSVALVGRNRKHHDRHHR